MVSVSEAEKLAEKLGVLYQEVSAQTGDHVADAFEAAVKLGHTRRTQQGKLSQKIGDKDSFDPTWIPPMSEWQKVVFLVSAWENSRQFMMSPTFPCKMISEKEVQKSYTDDVSLPRSG